LQGGLGAFIGAQYGKGDSVPVLVITGIIGICGYIGFFILEIRNTELITAGMHALDCIERQIATPTLSLPDVARAMSRRSDDNRRFLTKAFAHKRANGIEHPFLSFIFRHIIVYRAIFTLTLISWIVFVIYAAHFYHP
jgi:hypothetical protein